ncbi:Hypothetical predicted protein [Pelobates cultripes]|uniref:Uncharacterized protein n=1 Tax=Pelobates cultripes TaxID=61616 RepID=A0AAD1RKW5_PELCU|nr:Hypothetical predicted protein [Pelobates cultripes]
MRERHTQTTKCKPHPPKKKRDRDMVEKDRPGSNLEGGSLRTLDDNKNSPANNKNQGHKMHSNTTTGNTQHIGKERKDKLDTGHITVTHKQTDHNKTKKPTGFA